MSGSEHFIIEESLPLLILNLFRLKTLHKSVILRECKNALAEDFAWALITLRRDQRHIQTPTGQIKVPPDDSREFRQESGTRSACPVGICSVRSRFSSPRLPSIAGNPSTNEFLARARRVECQMRLFRHWMRAGNAGD